MLPFVFVNMAMTADGKIANAGRTISSFSSPLDHHRLLVLRSRADAVMAGARTIDQNPITLGPGSQRYKRMRLKQGFTESNLRIVVSGTGSVDPKAEIFRQPGSPIIVLTTDRIRKGRLKGLQAVASAVRICGQTEIDFEETFRWLRREWGIHRLLCEGGGELNAALFRAELVNELYLTVCPLIFGGRDAPTVADGADAQELTDSLPLRLRTMRRMEGEMFLVYEVLSQRLRDALPPTGQRARANRITDSKK